LAVVAKQKLIDICGTQVQSDVVVKLASGLSTAQTAACKSRVSMWHYGDVGDDDNDNVVM
jgi:hypothetical protein